MGTIDAKAKARRQSLLELFKTTARDRDSYCADLGAKVTALADGMRNYIGWPEPQWTAVPGKRVDDETHDATHAPVIHSRDGYARLSIKVKFYRGSEEEPSSITCVMRIRPEAEDMYRVKVGDTVDMVISDAETERLYAAFEETLRRSVRDLFGPWSPGA